ncbi:hypothetical protein TgHK011_007545 [Trichoderma gracile]|nr:hypothetical protein TgHK011_007545 [Trichoderma gracile]
MVSLPDPDDRDNQRACNSSRKRPSKASQETLSSSKRHRPHYPSTIPSRFWDKLSKVPLTRNALRELNWREEKRQIAPHNADQEQPPVQRLIQTTRSSLAQENHHQQSADQILDQLSPARLKKVRRFSSHGGPDLRDLIGPDESCDKETICTAEQAITIYVKEHKENHTHVGSYQKHRSLPPEPKNLTEIRQALAQRRASLSPSRFTDDDFRRFKRQHRTAQGEPEVISDVVPVIEGVQDKRNAAGDNAFWNLEYLTDDTLVPGKPDLYYGARPEQLNPDIRSALSGQIVPTAQEELPIAPNFFLEIKGPGANAEVAPRQVCYDGALGARGIQSLQSYGEAEKLYDNKAYALTCYYMGGILGIYTSHPIPPSHPGGQPGFVTTEVKQYLLTADAENFRQGSAAYRNGIDWAKRQRDEAINRANEKAHRAAQMDEEASQSPGPSPDVDVKLNFASEISISNTAADGVTNVPMPASRSLSPYEPDIFADEPSTDLPPPNALAHSHTVESPSLLSQEKVIQTV